MPLNSVSKKAKIGSNVTIGDFTVIKDDVEIGNDVVIGTNVLIDNGARIADGVKIHHGAAVSTIPQDLKFVGEHSILEIGENTIIREFATLNRGTAASGKTILGKNCLCMAYSHVAHDCVIGDNVILANSVNLAGHVELDDYVIVGGISGILQFVKVGAYTILSAFSRANKDVPPYITAGHDPLRYEGLNSIGLRRRKFTNGQINHIKDVYDVLYRSGLNISDAVKKINETMEITPETKVILDFIARSTKGIITSL
ncbi:MAG: acyl-ACP--UDP-N-acetylglucosamine O-acyltransferase [Ignavibacteria bacterium]|jgi:UDP-N-acetylglucosamine acyltransferase|nr:acyl-ACP--UDP-N-acetylglucosamine O-acyltransferase [Ignavibacteria bacterium]